MIIFCLPHAGGSKSSFANLSNDETNKNIKFFPIEYKGHASRYNEGLYSNLEEAINDITNIITLNNINDDYIILGNSMGAILAFCVCINMKRLNLKLPKCLLLFSSEPPKNIMYCKNNKEELISNINQLGFIPKTILFNKELYEIYSELIYEDLLLDIEGNKKSINQKVSIPIVAIYGKEDLSINENLISGWKNYTTNKFILKKCSGDHFFLINSHEIKSDFIYKILKEGTIL